MMGLDGRVAIVTGAASGIGRATSRRLNEEGAKVVMADIARPNGLNGEPRAALPAELEFVRTDVTSRAEVTTLFDRAMAASTSSSTMPVSRWPGPSRIRPMRNGTMS
jgi:NAD(P)-dependent dehydrogenase (short-subunit alcohol dehydrogenase family)